MGRCNLRVVIVNEKLSKKIFAQPMTKQLCPKCKKRFSVNLSGRIRTHRCIWFGISSHSFLSKTLPVHQSSPVHKSTTVTIPVHQSLVNKSTTVTVPIQQPSLPSSEICRTVDSNYQYETRKEDYREIDTLIDALINKKDEETTRQKLFHQPYNYIKQEIPPSSKVYAYWLDSKGGFYKLDHNNNPYEKSLNGDDKKKEYYHKDVLVTRKVYWNSKFGDTTRLVEGEWEEQEVWIRRRFTLRPEYI